MRITSGEYRGRAVEVPKSEAIRPTQDRVREALFSIVQNEIEGARFLDLFAGSGAVGIEALSRGASSAVFVESNQRHIISLNKNLEKIVARRKPVSVIRQDVYRWIESYIGGGFDIVYADPPYALGEEKGYADVLRIVAERRLLNPGGIFIAEMTFSQRVDEVAGWELIKDRTYGKTRLVMWRKNGIDK
jgi:16S rRNA (guanine966-N2)-methyltransferase